MEESQRATFASVSNNGTIVWASARAGDFAFAWYDRTGRRLEALPIASGKVVQPRLSPDDKKLVFTRVLSGMADLWLHDIASGGTTQVTTDPEYDENATWSPDSRIVAYQGNIDYQTAALLAPVDGSQRPRPILRKEFYSLGSFTRDGKAVILSAIGKNGDTDLALVRLDGPGVPEMLSPEPGLQAEPAISPDGQWLAFTTDRSGRPEVVLARLIDDGKTARLGDQRLPVSTAGGSEPEWRRDGQELVYLGNDRFLTAVPVTRAGGALTVGRPTRLFRLPIDAGGTASWSRTSDHTKFVIVEAPNADGQTFRVMTGWR